MAINSSTYTDMYIYIYIYIYAGVYTGCTLYRTPCTSYTDAEHCLLVGSLVHHFIRCNVA